MTEKPDMKTILPIHTEIEGFEVIDNCLAVGGRKITELAERAGQTPFYAYDRGLIATRIRKLRDELPQEVDLHYAMKANPMPAVVNHIAPLVDGLDIASGGELMVALDSGMDPVEISFAGPGKSIDEIRQAVAAGITVTLESQTEMDRACEAGEQLGLTPRVAVRVNPDFELKASGMKMSGGPKQFGIDAEIVPEVLTEIGDRSLEFDGFHIFCGSQNLREDAIIDAQQQTVDLALRLAESAPTAPRFINIGGGFGIPYFPGDKPIKLNGISEGLAQHVASVRDSLGDSRIVLELGRYIVGEAGVYVCRVRDRKVSRGQTFVIVDGGLHHHLAASGNFGQVIRKNYPVIVGNRVVSKELESQMIVGPLCTPLDVLGASMELPAADIGDFVVVLQSGAYGLTASPLGFLSHPAPVEILV